MKFSVAFAVLAALSLTASAVAAADTVVLRNGDRITGSFVSADAKTMAIKTPYEGQISVKWTDVKQITTTEPISVTNSSKRTVTGPISKTNDELIVHTSGGDVTVPIGQIVAVRSPAEEAMYEASLHPSLAHNWDGSFGLGFSLARGNSSATALTTSFNLRRKTLSDLVTMYESSVYSTATALNTVTANAILGGARYDRNVNDLLFWFTSADYTHDELQGLNLRQIYSGGLGWHAIANPNTTLNLLAGMNYTRETYTGSTTLAPGVSVQRNIAGVTAGEDFIHHFGKITSLTENFNFYPALSEPGQYRFTLNAAANTSVTGWLSWQVSVNDLYVSNPPLFGTKANDVILATSLVVSFRH